MATVEPDRMTGRSAVPCRALGDAPIGVAGVPESAVGAEDAAGAAGGDASKGRCSPSSCTSSSWRRRSPI